VVTLRTFLPKLDHIRQNNIWSREQLPGDISVQSTDEDCPNRSRANGHPDPRVREIDVENIDAGDARNTAISFQSLVDSRDVERLN
jgi:hypothetical protein